MDMLFKRETLVVLANVLPIDTTCPTTTWHEGNENNWELAVNIVVDDEALYAMPLIDLRPFSRLEVSVHRKKLRLFGRKWRITAAYIGDKQLYLQSYQPW